MKTANEFKISAEELAELKKEIPELDIFIEALEKSEEVAFEVIYQNESEDLTNETTIS